MADWVKSVSRFLGDRGTLFALNAYPPYAASGIRITEVASDLTRVKVQMGLHAWNRNFFGTHFGGSLYSMCDPFFLFMVMLKLGPDYVVWDKSASIKFLKPGKGTVSVSFEVPIFRSDQIRAEAASGLKVEPLFTTEIKDESGDVVAEVEKLLYVRLKRR